MGVHAHEQVRAGQAGAVLELPCDGPHVRGAQLPPVSLSPRVRCVLVAFNPLSPCRSVHTRPSGVCPDLVK